MKFIADAMLGGLGRILRMLGIDCLYFTGRAEELIISARREDRIVLTRNTKLKGREGIIFISEPKLIDQLKKLDRTYDIMKIAKPLTRCLICNEEITLVLKEDIKDKVPYYTYLNFDEFYRCPVCNRIYWNGSHRKGMANLIERIVDALD